MDQLSQLIPLLLSVAPKIGVGKSGFAGLPSLRTVHAVFPHTAVQSVVARQGLNVTCVGFSQTFEATLAEVGIGPAVRAA